MSDKHKPKGYRLVEVIEHSPTHTEIIYEYDDESAQPVTEDEYCGDPDACEQDLEYEQLRFEEGR